MPSDDQPPQRFYNDTDNRQCPAVDEQGLDCAAPEGHEPPHANVNGEWADDPEVEPALHNAENCIDCSPSPAQLGDTMRGGTVTDIGSRRHITQFRGAWAFLSNFHPAVLTWEGITYPTSEHAFNAGKTLDQAIRREIAAAPTPGQAKAMGRSVKLRPLWEASVRYEVMREVLRAKFTCHPGRVAALLGTGDAVLVEGNHHHDQHWGRCDCPQHKGVGDNHLGRMLMELRSELATDEPHHLAHQTPPGVYDPHCPACRR